jgi:SecD/SecF fusion protein
MKNKGFILGLTIVLAVLCLYQLSFTFVTNSVDKEIAEKVEAGEGTKAEITDAYRNKEVYPIFNHTYQYCKEREINLGLDLQGGMNVVMEVDIPSMVDELSNQDQDAQFRKAFNEAKSEFLGQQDFIDLFQSKYDPLNPAGDGLARIFYNPAYKTELPNEYSSTNEEIYNWLKTQSKSAIKQTFNVLKTRIEGLKVSQPNVQMLDNARIMLELPGIDDPDRVRNLVSTNAQLEFWTMYRKQDAASALEALDRLAAADILAEKEAAAPEDTATKEALMLDGTDEPAPAEDTASFDVIERMVDGEVVYDTVQKDSASSEEQLTREEALEKFPITARVQWNTVTDEASGQRMWSRTAPLAYVDVKDADYIQKYIDSAQKEELLPAGLHFRFDFKSLPSEEGDVSFMALYALESVDGKPSLSGDVVTAARRSLDQGGKFSVIMNMNQEGARSWEKITEYAAVNQDPVAIVLDDKVYSAPTVNEPISGGVSSITGNFDETEAEDLANVLESGKLDAKPNIVEESVVGPTLGQKSITAGLISLLVGFLAVIVFMLVYYARSGVYAVFALLANLFFILGVLSGFGAALTLPGMAGLVLTIGMAVDANVLIFERIKEELKTGKGFKGAVRSGYQAAYSSIIDANITTLIAAIILYNLGKGPVAGFAIILLIGILCSLFTAIFLTRLFIERDIAKGRDTSFSSSLSNKMFQKFNYNFIGNRKKFYIVSAIIIAAGVVSLATNGVSTGIDFKGGWNFLVELENDANDVEEIKTALGQNISENIQVKTYGSDNTYMITTSHRIEDRSDNVSQEVKNTVVTSLKSFGKVNVLSESKVGPTIAEDIKNNSTLAIILSLIGMFLYIVFRFRKWGYGLGATIALFHDVLIVFSLYSILYKIMPFSMDIDQAFIAAILTVVGYSINDTVVVFDRVREFLGIHKYTEDTKGVINTAINQTLSRTLVTSLTTFVVVLILFLAGGDGLKGFTFALLIGVAVGTYSSICVATPVVVDVTKQQSKVKKKKK